MLACFLLTSVVYLFTFDCRVLLPIIYLVARSDMKFVTSGTSDPYVKHFWALVRFFRITAEKVSMFGQKCRELLVFLGKN